MKRAVHHFARLPDLGANNTFYLTIVTHPLYYADLIKVCSTSRRHQKMKMLSFIENEAEFHNKDNIYFSGNKVYIIDINSFPGTAPSSFVFLQSAHANIYPIELIDKIKKQQERWEKSREWMASTVIKAL